MTENLNYKFLVSWYEPMAGITREYILTYMVSPGSTPNELSIYDIKNKKLFLKKVPYPTVTLSDLYVGNIVTIYSRQYEITAYGDSTTRDIFESKRGKLVVSIPETLYSEYGTILTEAANQNLQISMLKTVPSGPNGLTLWVEFVGDNIRENWERIVHRIPRLQEELRPSEDVMQPNEQTNRLFKGTETTASFDNCSLCVVKPHALKEGFTGAIFDALLEAKFEISAAQLYHLSRVEAENFLEVYKGVINNTEYSDLTAEFASGPLIAFEVRSENCVEKLRQLCGPHDVEIARALRPNTLRARFGKNNVQNAVHCTDLEEDGVLESQFFFDIVTKSQVRE